jgi:hypothetical protein
VNKLSGEELFDGASHDLTVWDVFVLVIAGFASGAELSQEIRTHEPVTLDLRIGVSVPSQSNEPRVYDQGPDVPGLFQMW